MSVSKYWPPWHFDYCPSASEGDNQSVRSSAPVVSRCFPGGYNVKLYISRSMLGWWLLAFLHSDSLSNLAVTDGLVARAGVSVTWTVLSWSGCHEFEPRSGRTWGARYLCPKSYLNQKYLSKNLITALFWASSCEHWGFSLVAQCCTHEP